MPPKHRGHAVARHAILILSAPPSLPGCRCPVPLKLRWHRASLMFSTPKHLTRASRLLYPGGMRKGFPWFYVRRDETFFKDLWDRGRFVFDTNMLLNFFRYSSETREALYNFLSSDTVKDRLWIPWHVADEYHRNLSVVRYEPVKALHELKAHLGNTRSGLKADEHRGRLDKLLADVDGFLKEASTKFESKDELAWVDKVADPYGGKVGEPFKDEELKEVRAQGEERYKRRIPPGFADASKKAGDERFGDLVIWKEVIRFAKQQAVPVVFVTDDVKEDWWERVGGKIVGPLPALLQEMAREASADALLHVHRRELPFVRKKVSRGSADRCSDDGDRPRARRAGRNAAASATQQRGRRYWPKVPPKRVFSGRDYVRCKLRCQFHCRRWYANENVSRMRRSGGSAPDFLWHRRRPLANVPTVPPRTVPQLLGVRTRRRLHSLSGGPA